MALLSVMEGLAPVMFLICVLGFALCLRALFVRVRDGKIKMPYVSIVMLLVPILFFISSKGAVTGTFRELVADSETLIDVQPSTAVSSRNFLEIVLNNLYTSKGRSGSRPTKIQYTIVVCKMTKCGEIEVAQDSRDSNMYWVNYKPSAAFTIPLGFTSLAEVFQN